MKNDSMLNLTGYRRDSIKSFNTEETEARKAKTTNSYTIKLFSAFIMVVCALNVFSDDSLGEKMLAMPLSKGKAVKIDGNLQDWDMSGSEWFCYSTDLADLYSGKIALMYDDDALYIAADILTGGGPIYNPNTPSERPWEGHEIEFRLINTPKVPFPLNITRGYKGEFAKNIFTVTMWKNSVSGKSNVNITNGPPYKSGVKSNPSGVKIAVKGKNSPDSYILEAKIPWKCVGVADGKNPFKPGDEMTAFLTVIWPGQKRIEALRIGQTGNFGWAAWNVKNWGQVEFSEKGNIQRQHQGLMEYIASKEKHVGAEITVDLPKSLKTSVSIVDDKGEIIREIIGGKRLPAGKSKVYWDGFDWKGNPMKTGTYTWKAYASPGLSLQFLGGVGSSGQPPYKTNDGTGDWGGDHGNPIDVACDATGTYFLWEVNEMGKAIVKINNEGKTSWRNTPFIMGGSAPNVACAANGKFLFVAVGTKNVRIARFNAKNGLFTPFSKEESSIAAVTTDTGSHAPEGRHIDFYNNRASLPNVMGLAANKKELFVSDYLHQKILVFDVESGKKIREMGCEYPRGLSLDRNNNLWVISKNIHSGRKHYPRVLFFQKAAGKARQRLVLSDVINPWDIAVHNSRAYISEPRFSNQIWMYDLKSKKLIGKLGKRGGRPWGGKYQPDNFLYPTGLATTATGELYVAQSSIPKVFQRYKVNVHGLPLLGKEWFGPCAYSPSSWADSRNPLAVYVSMEPAGFIRGILKGDGSNAEIDAYWNFERMGYPEEFYNFGSTMQVPVDVELPDGKQYIVCDNPENLRSARGIVRVDGYDMVPVGYVRNLGSALPGGDGKFGLELWSDLNHNRKVDKNEIEKVYKLAGVNLTNPKYLRTYSGFSRGIASLWMDNKGDLYLINTFNCIFKIPVRNIDEQGIITWDTTKAKVVAKDIIPGVEFHGSYYRSGILGVRADKAGNIYSLFATNMKYANSAWTKGMKSGLCHTGEMNAVKLTKFNNDGKREWLVGCKATTVAKPGEIYNPWVLGGLVGQGYLATASEWTPVSFYSPDGFFVDTVLGDPNRSSRLDAYNIGGGETFAGRVKWYPKRGECYLYTGSTAGLAYKVNGFTKEGKIKGEIRFDGTVSLKEHFDPFASMGERKATVTEIVKLKNPIKTKKWGDKPQIIYGKNGKQLAKLNIAYDADNLYARFDVKDSTPLENKADAAAMAFKKGDCVGLYFGKAGKKRKAPQTGDIRLLATLIKNKPVVIAMIPQTKGTKRPQTYYTPAGGRRKFDFVGILEKAKVKFTKRDNGYIAEIMVPLNIFDGLSFKPGEKLAFEAEVLLSGMGQRGFQTLSRNHLYTPGSAGQATMVDDIPSEARLYPQYWGDAKVK